jgi:hypothetical protein
MGVKQLSGCVIFGLAISASLALADDQSARDPNNRGSIPASREFSPMTQSERLSNYAAGLFSYESFFTAAAAAGISQATNTPKEWGGGAEAFGKRIGSYFAQDAIRETLQYAASATLHEDNRYFASRQTGFFNRTKYAAMSTLLARHDDGSGSFSFSRVGSTAAASFISRAWQPASTTTAGDGAVNFGLTMGAEMGMNVFREFWPDVKRHFRKK